MLARVQLLSVKQREVDFYNFGIPFWISSLIASPVSRQQALTERIAMKIERYLTVRHKHMVASKALVWDDPLPVESTHGRFFKKYSGQDMACAEPEEDAIWLVPAFFRILFYSRNWTIHEDVHSASSSGP